MMSSSTPLPDSSYRLINNFVSELERHELKPCISLVRYGIIPTELDSAIWDSLPKSLLDKLFVFQDGSDPSLTSIGEIFFAISTNPLISSSIISFCLAVEPSPDQVRQAFIDSASKEHQVLDSHPRQTTINWKPFFFPKASENYVLPHQTKDATAFVQKINSKLRQFRDRIEFKRIWPYGTSRGISKTGRESLIKLRSELSRTPWLTEEDKRRPPTSQDVVNMFIHEGLWAKGVCEMKQKWYPAQLVPRTYFAQGGNAIRVSCYLRNFFNDLTDTYLPTERRARVDGSRLICPDGGHFIIYDLTSFTSNFHEQQSFLRNMADFFRETLVFLIGHNLSLEEHYLGDLIDEYCEEVNTLPQYEFNKGILDFSLEALTFTHHVAGFLGVPGNLATCTLAHGISIGICVDSDKNQSCAGDDGNVGVRDDIQEQEVRRTVHSLGTFNDEKMSTTKITGRGSYLKRPFRQVMNQGIMINRVDFPLMGSCNLMIKDDLRFPELSKDRSKLRQSLASSISRLFRSLYEHSSGEISDDILTFILSFIQEFYAKASLPSAGMVRGFYGSDLDVTSFRIEAAVVFPVSERYLRRDPDVVLTEDFLPWITEVPVWTDETIQLSRGEDWPAGESRKGRSSPVLDKLVVLGFLERTETERMVLMGPDARRHFRRFDKEDFVRQEYTYTAKLSLNRDQVLSTGLSGLTDLEWKRQFVQPNVSVPLSFRPFKDHDAAKDSHDDVSAVMEDLY